VLTPAALTPAVLMQEALTPAALMQEAPIPDAPASDAPTPAALTLRMDWMASPFADPRNSTTGRSPASSG
jgi:hypothetical protein